MQKWANTIAGAALFLFAATSYFLIPSQIAMIETEQMHVSPSFYPRLVITLTAIISIVYLLTSFLEAKRKSRDLKGLKLPEKRVRLFGESSVRTLTTLAIILGYIYLLEFMGFFIATPIGLGALMYHMGNRRIVIFCLIIIIVPVITYFLFERALYVFLPRGPF